MAIRWKCSRPRWTSSIGGADWSRGSATAMARRGRSPFDPVSMFTALILQAQHNLSDAQMELWIRDKLS